MIVQHSLLVEVTNIVRRVQWVPGPCSWNVASMVADGTVLVVMAALVVKALEKPNVSGTESDVKAYM